MWWKWYGSCPTGATMGWEEISEGDTLTIWGMFEDCAYWTEGSPNTAPFQPTNPTSLTGDSDENNHPVLTWNANTEIDRAGYKLRRSLDWGPWITIANLSKSATNYIDEEVLKSNEFRNDKYAHYKLFAYNIAANESDYAGPVVVRHSGLVFKQIAENPNSEVVPETFVLHGAFPNPFNAATTIHYALPEFSYVEITVFDIMGREVTTLINGFVNAGFKERVWDGANASGQPVPSGMYFYRLDARAIESGERFYQTRKMVLLR
ncbi:MAG: T9SS type A sorting domain-containing protein [Candidatus Marinimicrobia bacterium]|nr:T9SS type A sorting domain-containing protein [Candidatus Neomarinimicrobiota bacterium]